MFCFSYISDELLSIGRLALPSIILNGLHISMMVINIIYMGHIGRDALSTGAMGMAFYNILWYFIEGLLSAQDSLAVNAYNSRDYVAVRHWSYVSAIVMLMAILFGSILMVFSPIIVRNVMFLDDPLAERTVEFIFAMIPSLWFQGGFRVLQKYLQAQRLYFPPILCQLASLGVNVMVNSLLLFGLGFGAFGSAIATTLANGCAFSLIITYLVYIDGYTRLRDEFMALLSREVSDFLSEESLGKNVPQDGGSVELGSLSRRRITTEDEEDGEEEASVDRNGAQDTDSLLSRDSVDKKQGKQIVSSVGSWNSQLQRDCLRFLALGIPGGIVLVTEQWAFEVVLLVVSQIGPVSISAQQVVICLINLMYTIVPISLSTAATVRISQLLAAQNSKAARISCILSLVVSGLFMCIIGAVLYRIRHVIGYAFTSDPDIINRIHQLCPIVSLFHVVYGFQGPLQGALRGMARHTEVLGYTFLSYWVLGVPVGMYLAFFTRPRNGLYGLWYGLATGVGFLVFILLLIVITTDWELEVRRERIRVEKYQNSFSIVQACPVPGSRAQGGFLLVGSSGDEELDEIERIEISFFEQDSEGKDHDV